MSDLQATQRQRKAQNALRFIRRYVDAHGAAIECGNPTAAAITAAKARYWQARYMRLTAHDRRGK